MADQLVLGLGFIDFSFHGAVLDEKVSLSFGDVEKGISAITLVEDSFVMSEFLLSEIEEDPDNVIGVENCEHFAVEYLVGIF